MYVQLKRLVNASHIKLVSIQSFTCTKKQTWRKCITIYLSSKISISTDFYSYFEQPFDNKDSQTICTSICVYKMKRTSPVTVTWPTTGCYTRLTVHSYSQWTVTNNWTRLHCFLLDITCDWQNMKHFYWIVTNTLTRLHYFLLDITFM